MDDAIKRFQQRRSARLGFDTIKHYDSVKEYRKRRAERLAARMDAEGDEESAPAPKKGGGGHGNTKLPFGLCQREGIEVKPGWTPQDAWKALEGKGYSAGEAYKELKETGKVSKKQPGHGQTKPQKDYSSMKYEELETEFSEHLKRYEEQEDLDSSNKRKAKRMESELETLKRIKDRNGYQGESYEQVSNVSSDDKNYWRYGAIKNVMDTFGHDVFDKDFETLQKEIAAEVERLRTPTSYKSLNEERAQITAALAEKAKEKYPKLSDCDSAIALESRLRADDFYKSGDWVRERLDYSGMNPKHATAIGKGLQVISKRFPELKGMLPVPMMEKLDGNTWAEVRGDDTDYPELYISKYEFRNDGMTKRLKEGTKSGFHPKGTGTVQGILTHEYGHVIDGILSRKFKDELGGKNFSAYVLSRIADNHSGESKESIMESVSRYSVNNDEDEGVEFLAEAFSEYCCTAKPRPIAKEVGQIMTEFIKRL